MAIRWTRGALRNLQDLLAYIAADNPGRAVTFARELKDKIECLDEFPGLGHAGRMPGTRELVLHANYRVIYRTHAGTVQVLRIQHNAMRPR
ncbi:type II toxin-antitoxin system RelE/ParE family toxin [Roseateles puraquae]|jgi:addiction module RelE/StbE family toxin|uniref:Type II toxin-antitoxin system mRNA interferase toxin, RelE/StbE family n=1 Tax=Roseateles puraquae TaxID=431059 RepID=A0A254N7J1_9BURK|nr:type II toxin-antitoxin system RelE/ParE family toxin [Roseateles puraquae]MDG0856631.1 type II toxin-antitoxin system RelE/ParE family toxin [Roseateles puraquae]OWR00636.1 type II toxin-antitoxin system mRNA interferase toxin, RelE/StbE family [Roseateles puraquae]